MFEFLAERGTASERIVYLRDHDDLTLKLIAGEEVATVSIDRNEVMVRPGDANGRAIDLTLEARPEDWEKLFSSASPPEFQTLSAMRRTGHLTISGDFLKFYQHLMLLELLFSLADRGVAAVPSVAEPEIEPIVGRYLRLELGGRAHRVYFEEAGAGIPLICLHTAGADGRQYRAILNDPEITNRFRVIVFDMPWHGKSSPPTGFESEVYRLTTDAYVEMVMALCAALKLENPVVMGCSIGGRAVLHLALRHGDRFRAAIGLQSALYAEANNPGEPPDMRPLFRPDVHGGNLAGALMAGLIAPQSPSADGWETMWHYMQGGPGVFIGDLHYYFTDGDLRNQSLDGLDQERCPIYLLTGEYDISATPEMTRDLAAKIGAAHCEIMRGMGHFPMSENPDTFRTYLLPVLEKIEAHG